MSRQKFGDIWRNIKILLLLMLENILPPTPSIVMSFMKNIKAIFCVFLLRFQIYKSFLLLFKLMTFVQGQVYRRRTRNLLKIAICSFVCFHCILITFFCYFAIVIRSNKILYNNGTTSSRTNRKRDTSHV